MLKVQIVSESLYSYSTPTIDRDSLWHTPIKGMAIAYYRWLTGV